MDNPERLAPLGTQETKRRQTRQKHNKICVGHCYEQNHTNEVNKI